MRIALLGATGRTGRLAAEAALEGGHHVVALSRAGSTPLPERSGLEVVTGDARDEDALSQLVAGVDAVVSALGPRGRDDTLLTTVAQGLRSAMTSAGVRRFVGVSVAGLDLPGDRKGRRDRVIGSVVRTLARGATRDREGELRAWRTSGLDWTLVRVPRLVDGTETPEVTLDAHVPPRATTLHRTALARVLVSLAADGRFVGQAPFCADA